LEHIRHKLVLCVTSSYCRPIQCLWLLHIILCLWTAAVNVALIAINYCAIYRACCSEDSYMQSTLGFPLFLFFGGDRRASALLLANSLLRVSYIARIFCIFVTHLWLYTIIVPTCAWAGYHNTKMYHGTYVSLNIMMPLSKNYRVNLCLAFGKGICDPN